MNFAKQLKSLLRRDGITVSHLSRKTGIPAKTIYHYLEGRTPRKLEHVKVICESFQVTSDYLLFGVQPIGSDKQEFVAIGTYDVYLKKRNSIHPKEEK